MTVRSLTQHNSNTHEISNNIRFNFIYKPGSDIYRSEEHTSELQSQ